LTLPIDFGIVSVQQKNTSKIGGMKESFLGLYKEKKRNQKKKHGWPD
jgi:hypothetical protein